MSETARREARADRFILVHYGELGLKGQNQPHFLRQLGENLTRRLAGAGFAWKVRPARGYLSIPIPSGEIARAGEALEVVAQVFGVAWAASSLRVPHHDFDAPFREQDYRVLEETAVSAAREAYAPGKGFCVRVSRAEKNLPFTSPEMERRLGTVILQNTDWERVDLTHPDRTFYFKFQKRAIHVFAERRPGPGGLPVGTAGRVLVLFSGGIDSPVAAYLMAKRGCWVDFLHFTATSEQQEDPEREKVCRLARRLADYTLCSRLYLVPYTYFDLALLRGRVDYDLILFRRFMVRVAERLARRIGAEALASGDNLSQVASQTLSNLVSTSQAVELPLLRPLLAYNKTDIMALAEKIGTFQESIQAYKDCCSLIGRHPKTRSDPARLAALEAEMLPDYEGVLDRTLRDLSSLDLMIAES